MTRDEVVEILSYVQAFDRRNVGDVEIEAWHSLLANLDAGDVGRVVRAHFAETTEWLMPAHIVRGVKEVQAGRLRRYGSIIPEEVWPELEHEQDAMVLLAKTRELGALVAAGRITRDRSGRPELPA